MQSIPVAVIGVGHLGYHHARVYADMDGADLIGVVDTNAERAETVAAEFNCEAHTSIDALLDRVEAASVVVPTPDHAQVALPCIEAGINVLIEKPIASTLAEADAMIDAATKKNLVLQVGHLERFNGAVRKLREVLTDPLFIEGHRMAMPQLRATDVSVVLDLMIHDLDIVLSIFDEEPTSFEAVGVPIVSDHEDLANVRLRFPNGCIANLSASRVSMEPMRKIRFFQRQTYISLDYRTQEMQIYRMPEEGIDLANIDGPPFDYEHLRLDDGEPLRTELEAFLGHIRDGSTPEVSGEDARKALKLALDIMGAMQKHYSQFEAAGGAYG